MNLHLSPREPGIREQLQREAAETEQDAETRRRSRIRLWLILAAVLAGVALFAWLLILRAGAGKPTAPESGPPPVSVIVPGQTPVADRVAAVGSITARRDMPVGVVGEGGSVSRILVEAGQYVRAGQVMAELDSSVQRAQLQQLEASVVQAQADARLAQSELDRAQALVARGFISKADIDRRTATRDSANARVAVARAQVREMQARIGRLAIRSPEGGLVLARNVEPGQVVSPGSGALYRVASGGRLEVRAQIAEQDMVHLKTGQPVVVTPVGSSTEYAGNVWMLEPAIDPQTRLGTARVALPASPDLRVGGFANVVIDGAIRPRPIVPQSAIQSDQDGSYVLIVAPDDSVRRQPVTIGSVNTAGIAIASGLTGAEKVVTVAAPFLHVGEKVKPVIEKAASPAAAPAASAPAAKG